MSLDVFVMPLWRYWTGEFQTPLERAMIEQGAQDRYVRTRPKPAASHADAKSSVEALQRQILHNLGPGNRWRDDGEIVFSQQFSYNAWHALRAFAADHQYQQPNFVFDQNAHLHPALPSIYAGGRTRFPNLIRHPDHCGFWLPVRFEEPFDLGVQDPNGVRWYTGSSYQLLKELTYLGGVLGLTLDRGQEGWTLQFENPDDPLMLVYEGWALMRWAARSSTTARLPIVFDG